MLWAWLVREVSQLDVSMDLDFADVPYVQAVSVAEAAVVAHLHSELVTCYRDLNLKVLPTFEGEARCAALLFAPFAIDPGVAHNHRPPRFVKARVKVERQVRSRPGAKVNGKGISTGFDLSTNNDDLVLLQSIHFVNKRYFQVGLSRGEARPRGVRGPRGGARM